MLTSQNFTGQAAQDQWQPLNPDDEQRHARFIFPRPRCSATADNTRHRGTLLSAAPVKQLLVLEFSEQQSWTRYQSAPELFVQLASNISHRRWSRPAFALLLCCV